MPAVMDRTIASGQPTQPCPACDGTMPAEAIKFTAWRHRQDLAGPFIERTVAMHCPHCGHQDAKTIRRPQAT